jgi:hypothetical protein
MCHQHFRLLTGVADDSGSTIVVLSIFDVLFSTAYMLIITSHVIRFIVTSYPGS